MDTSSLSQQAAAVLEWPRLLDVLAGQARSPMGAEACRRLSLEKTLEGTRRRMQETAEMAGLRESTEPFPSLSFPDLREVLKRSEKGATLETHELRDLSIVLGLAADVIRYVDRRRDEVPALSAAATPIEGLRSTQPAARLKPVIDRCIDPEGNIRESATPDLRRLMHQAQALKQSMRRRLEMILSSRRYADVLQEQYFAQREGRYVIPIKAEMRGKIPGIVHDLSGSGATVFLEPRELVDLNNAIKVADLDVEREVKRILQDLSLQVAGHAQALLAGLDGLAVLDCIAAKAGFSHLVRGADVALNDQGRVILKQARHPLLMLARDHVVANDIEMDEQVRVLVISGPNTGGKTVTLKIVGLFALMVRGGLHPPCGALSEMAVFSEIYADIGDAQDLTKDLSSFSAHMTQMIRLLEEAGSESSEKGETGEKSEKSEKGGKGETGEEGETGGKSEKSETGDTGGKSGKGGTGEEGEKSETGEKGEKSEKREGDEGGWGKAGEKSGKGGKGEKEDARETSGDAREGPVKALVLLDEPVTSTDPNEGAALAEALLIKLAGLGMKVIATTHYNSLKALAQTTAGFMNASVEFDVTRLAPTYRVIMGIPGGSSAIDIAGRLGMDETILDHALGLLRREDRTLDQLLGELQDKHRRLDEDLSRAAESRAAAERSEREAAEAAERVQLTEREQRRGLKKKLTDELHRARAQVQEVLDGLKGERTLVKAREAKQRLAEIDEQIRAQLVPEEEKIPLDQLAVGDRVEIVSLGAIGTLLEAPLGKKRVRVRIGEAEMSVAAALLTGRTGKPEEESRHVRQDGTFTGRRKASTDSLAGIESSSVLDLRGTTADDALDMTVAALDRAALSGAPTLRIIHGHGTGRLKTVLRDYLRDSPYVAAFRPGDRAEGGDGVTIAELR